MASLRARFLWRCLAAARSWRRCSLAPCMSAAQCGSARARSMAAARSAVSVGGKPTSTPRRRRLKREGDSAARMAEAIAVASEPEPEEPAVLPALDPRDEEEEEKDDAMACTAALLDSPARH